MQGTQVRSLVREDPHAVEQLSPCATTTEPVRLEPMLCNEKPPQWEARAQQRRPNAAKNKIHLLKKKKKKLAV